MKEKNKDEVYNEFLKQIYEEETEKAKKKLLEKLQLHKVYLDIIEKYKHE